MNWVDGVIVGLPALLALLGLFQGFVRQAASWGGLVAGYLVGARWHGSVRDALGLPVSRGSDAIAFLAAFAAAYLAVRLVGLLAERWLRGTALSGAERFAGAVAGFAKGCVLAILFAVLAGAYAPRGYAPFARSRCAAPALAAGARLSRLLPGAVGDAFRSVASRASENQPGNRPAK